MKKRELEYLDTKNKNLANLFSSLRIKKIKLTSMGNSIASGFSFIRVTKPLLLRNENLKEIMKDYGVDTELHIFSRSQNNNDEHFYEWLITNIKESEIAHMNRCDYLEGIHGMNPSGITEEEIYSYFPLERKVDKGISDLLKESEPNTANILIYNGCTGSFLDSNMRNGMLQQRLTYGVNRDLASIEAVLKTIQTYNRYNGSNTQVYLCGVPNLLGLRVSDIMNSKLRAMALKYANVVYVKPVASKLFYKPIDDESHRVRFDVHFDEKEYIELNSNIMKSIYDNYETTKAMINLDRGLYNLSKRLEFDRQGSISEDLFDSLVARIIHEESKTIGEDKKDKYLTEAKKYFVMRCPYDFYYIGRDKIKESFSLTKNNKKNI